MHPWYLTLLVPLLCVYPSMWVLVFTGTIYVAHSVPGREKVELGLKVVEYLPFYLGLILLARTSPPVVTSVEASSYQPAKGTGGPAVQGLEN
jgi:hypothetical protein